MLKLLSAAAAIGLLATASGASAQDQRGNGADAGQGARPSASQPREGGAAHAPSASHATSADHPTAARQGQTTERAVAPRTTTTHSATATSPAHRNGAATVRTTQTSRPTTTHNTTNVASLQRNVQATHHYQAGAYRQPQGYTYRQWGYGQRLPTAYYASSYWINNYLAYALMAPPSGLVWVRVGPDALLINRYTGEVIQVQYGLFE